MTTFFSLVVKEPPYCVKESGYAGFILHIEVIPFTSTSNYKTLLKNNDLMKCFWSEIDSI